MGSKVKRELLKTPRGTRDLLESELSVVRKIQKTAQEFSSYYGFQEIQTPHFEHAELFGASLGESTDVVEKQTYTFRTRGGDALVLRPEGTVPAVRAYFEHGLGSWPQPVMLYYSGSFFRHESPQKGRFREFNQFGLEILGEELAVAALPAVADFGFEFLNDHLFSLAVAQHLGRDRGLVNFRAADHRRSIILMNQQNILKRID